MDTQLQIRYLLELVTRKVGDDDGALEEFLSSLACMGRNPNRVCHFIKNKLAREESGDEDIPLNKGDIGFLTELLVEVSHKWELIGISLGLAEYEIKNCTKNDNKISLNQIVTCWVSRDNCTLTEQCISW